MGDSGGINGKTFGVPIICVCNLVMLETLFQEG